MPDKKPLMQELAKADHGILSTASFTNMLIENPDTVLQRRGGQFEIYDELLRDDQVKSAYQQRRTGMTSKSWSVEPATESAEDKKAADFLTEQLEHIGWDDKCDKMHYGIFYGYAIAEAMWGTDGKNIVLDDLKVRDRSRFKFNKDNDLFLIHSQKPQGILMPERKFWTLTYGSNHDDNPYGLGLAHSLYWPVFFKRNDIKFWLVFLEKFGMPTTAIRLPEGQMADVRQINKAKDALAAIQSDSGVVIPDGMVVELIEAARSGTADYDKMLERMDKAISKVVLSQTMTTDDGSSKSQAEVHEGVSLAVIDADSDLINESFTNTVARWLIEWNFPNANVPTIIRNTEPEEDLNERAERDAKIISLGYEPTEEYIEETYGVGWTKKKEQPVTPELMNTGKGQMPADFAEVSALLMKRADHREDQESIARAAEILGSRYRDIYGKRVEQLLAYLDDSKDIETFQKHLLAMIGEPAQEQAVEAVQQATVFGRLMGMMRGQRN